MKYYSRKKISWVYVLILTFAISGCGGGGGGGGGGPQGTPIPNASVGGCFLENYSGPTTSEYVLPYQVGMTFDIIQGNCGRITHAPNCFAGGFPCGDLRYAYDHDTPIGTVVLAARGGTVIGVADNFPNGTLNGTQTNFINIRHSDGSIGRYLHNSPNTAMVMVGQAVSQGDPIAMSGNSGFTNNFPHIHFDVIASQSATCQVNVNFASCRTLPITFRNANPLDAPLIEFSSYEALPF